jgi:hypothetical protein
MPTSDEDAEHTIGYPEPVDQPMDHNMVYVAGEKLKFCPFYAHEMGAKRRKKCQTSPSQLDAGI